MSDLAALSPIRTPEELQGFIPTVDGSPKDAGVLTLIVRRPKVNEREILDAAELDLVAGLVGDNWTDRPSSRMPGKAPHPDMQLNVMNSRMSAFLAFGDVDRQALAGDQLHLDLDLSHANLPVGTVLVFGEGENAPAIEVTEQPHTGCKKFVARFGAEAMRFVNGEFGRPRRLRGLNAKVVRPGTIQAGDRVRVVRPAETS